MGLRMSYWDKSRVAVIGAGAWGTVLAQLVAQNCEEVRLFCREDELARKINATRANPDYSPGLQLHSRIQASADLDKVFHGGVQAMIWALPSEACREQAKLIARWLSGSEVILHATKGVEQGTLKRVSEILTEELPCPRVGVISGPNLAHEIAQGEPAATVVASNFDEVIQAGQELLSTQVFRVYAAQDVIGVEWSGVLKNILAIASGSLDAMKFGWNARSLMITRGLAEMVRFGAAMGAKESTFLGLAGVGDLLATASSPKSRNYQVGFRLGQGEKLEAILSSMGAVAEGVRTTRSVWQFAKSRGISMPITEAVHELLSGGAEVPEMIRKLMSRPQSAE